jgi:SAM-dependent methyltransferase
MTPDPHPHHYQPLLKPKRAPNFNLLARPYRWFEYSTFGRALERSRSHFLSRSDHPLLDRRSALILGDGDGRFTALLLRTNPQIRVHALDVSPGMLSALQKSTAFASQRVTTAVADLRSWYPSSAERYDLVVTHFFLDCLTTAEAAKLINNIQPALEDNTLWLVSEFAIPPTSFGQFVARPLVAFLYLAFRLLTGLSTRKLPDYPQALRGARWSLLAEHTRLRGLLVSQIWQQRCPAPTP